MAPPNEGGASKSRKKVETENEEKGREKGGANDQPANILPSEKLVGSLPLMMGAPRGCFLNMHLGGKIMPLPRLVEGVFV